ncbi:MAG: thylakoid membrane photosystem I accumulation factor [Cyanobacteria bacterium J06621_8]
MPWQQSLISKLSLSCKRLALGLLAIAISLTVWISPVAATINDDSYEGSIYVLFAGNGSLVPPRMDLATSLKREKPAILIFYIDDSSDCKQYSIEVNRLQEFYGRAASLIPVSVDSLNKDEYSPTEAGYYYSGVVPETVILDQQGEVVYDGKGRVPYEEVDDVLRKVFNLLPRAESEVLKRRPFNEFNAEITSD